jgi:hypothetical protein
MTTIANHVRTALAADARDRELALALFGLLGSLSVLLKFGYMDTREQFEETLMEALEDTVHDLPEGDGARVAVEKIRSDFEEWYKPHRQ